MRVSKLTWIHIRHSLKVFPLLIANVLLVAFLAPHVSNAIAIAVFLLLFVFIVLPAQFAVGPIGRWLGKELNESSVAADREYRRSLGRGRSTDVDG